MSEIPRNLSGDTTFDIRGFRQCLGQFSTGVTIITAQHDGRRAGVTANSFGSLSLDPPLVLWSIGRTSRAFDVLNAAENFAISILADDQVDVSQHFSSKEVDKFEGVAWHAGENGAPRIDRSAAYIECKVEHRHDGGDHILFIARVSHFSVERPNVLIFSQGRYAVGVDHPGLRSGVSGDAAGSHGAGAGPDTFGDLLFNAHSCWSIGFGARRRSIGISIGKGRLLALLSKHGTLGFDEAVRRASLPARELEDEISDLVESGDVHRNSDRSFSLTEAGRARREMVRQQVSAYESETLKDIPATDIAATKRSLAHYCRLAIRDWMSGDQAIRPD